MKNRPIYAFRSTLSHFRGVFHTIFNPTRIQINNNPVQLKFLFSNFCSTQKVENNRKMTNFFEISKIMISWIKPFKPVTKNAPQGRFILWNFHFKPVHFGLNRSYDQRNQAGLSVRFSSANTQMNRFEIEFDKLNWPRGTLFVHKPD